MIHTSTAIACRAAAFALQAHALDAAIREVSPGRLLYVHDAPNLRALYVDVERITR